MLKAVEEVNEKQKSVLLINFMTFIKVTCKVVPLPYGGLLLNLRQTICVRLLLGDDRFAC